jgi:DNA-binding transcriptional LysR family regulator
MSFKNLDLNLLRVFDAIMAEKNLTRAADRLAMTQPAVSNALKRLRDSLNDELVVRTAHGVRATARADELWPTVRETMGALQAAIAPGAFDLSRVEASFRMAMADSTASMFLPSVVKGIESEARGIRLRMVPLLTRDPRPLLLSSDIDLAVGSFPGVLAQLTTAQGPQASAIRHQGLYNGKYVCVMRADHPFAQEEMTLERFCHAHHLQVSFSGRAHGLVDEELAKIGRKRLTRLTVNQYFTAGRIIANSDLITILPLHLIAATGMKDALTWKELPLTLPTFHVDMLWHERNVRNRAHQWLRQQIVHAVETSQGNSTIQADPPSPA